MFFTDSMRFWQVQVLDILRLSWNGAKALVIHWGYRACEAGKHRALEAALVDSEPFSRPHKGCSPGAGSEVVPSYPSFGVFSLTGECAWVWVTAHKQPKDLTDSSTII